MTESLPYSRLDRLVHNLLSSRALREMAIDMEARLDRAEARAPAAPPIFVTSLPRAGTTLLLELLSKADGVVAHSYRHMPLVMAPRLWSRLSGRFRKQGTAQERAHGDGMVIDYDSPEAFEEILWLHFYPEHYKSDRIEPWGADEFRQDFLDFFHRHMASLGALADRDGARYLSKNNANIARLELLRRMFAQARILVPVRHPTTHAGSMHRQHRQFAERHGQEPFVRKYMADIGHFEFGALHRPITFPGTPPGAGPDQPDYWLAYWIRAMRHIRAHRDTVHILGYEDFCAGGTESLAALADDLGLDMTQAMRDAAAAIRPPGSPGDAAAPFDAGLLAEAEDLYSDLTGRNGNVAEA